MSLIAPLPRGRGLRDPEVALWDRDPTLLPLLRAIVVEAAAAGAGARLIMALPRGEPGVLVSAQCGYQPWRPLAMAVLERGEARGYPGAVAAPIHGAQGLRGALIIYWDPSLAHLEGEYRTIAHAHAAHVRTLLGTAVTRLLTIQATAEALLATLAVHDPATARHTRAVCQITHTLGMTLELPPHELRDLECAALLHDLGKIAVPLPLLEKIGPLTTCEWALMRQHPATGERIVRTIPELLPIAPAIRHHHERWDGNGYPDRLSGEAIPLHARLIALVDAYETMRVGRPYRPARDCEDSLHELRRNAGTQFDPDLIALLPTLTSFNLLF